MADALTNDIFKSLPIAELHCHLEATVDANEARRLAARNSVDISAAFDANGAYKWRTFWEFLQVYDAVSEAIRTPEDYFEITLRHYQRMAAKGMIYGEVIVSPAHAGRLGISYAALIDAVASAIEEAQAETGVVGRIIVTCVRHFGAEHALSVAKMAHDQPHPCVTAFGMAGDEAYGATGDFRRAFEIAGDCGLGLTAHAGEILGPASMREAISLLGISRIGHGVRAIEDASLVAEIKDRGLTLEVCPTSNVSIGLYPSLASHPLPRLVAAGLRVTLNSDDPAFFGADAADEYERNAVIHGFGRRDLLKFTQTAIDAAFCDAETKARMKATVRDAGI
jgi:adenosine deaminase